jgi:hypothetical protein
MIVVKSPGYDRKAHERRANSAAVTQARAVLAQRETERSECAAFYVAVYAVVGSVAGIAAALIV